MAGVLRSGMMVRVSMLWKGFVDVAPFVAMLLATQALGQSMPVPTEIYGSYAPGGECSRQPRVVASVAGLFLETAAGRTGPLPVDVCYCCAGGARYEGIQVWVLIRYGKGKWGGNTFSVTMMFNDGERRGALLVEQDDTLRTPIGMPMTQVVQARTSSLCKTPKAGA